MIYGDYMMTNTNTNPSQLADLRTAAAAAGDHAQVLLCDLALGDVELTGDTTLASLPIAAFISQRDQRRIAAMSHQEILDACAEAIGTDMGGYEASLPAALAWATDASDGDYLVQYEDTGMTDVEDPGSRCGYSDQDLAEIAKALGRRDLCLVADDRGLVAQAVRS